MTGMSPFSSDGQGHQSGGGAGLLMAPREHILGRRERVYRAEKSNRRPDIQLELIEDKRCRLMPRGVVTMDD